MELITYLLKVSACTILFFAFYLLVLRRLTFFKINRFYLLFTLLLSFVIPALDFTIQREVAAIEVIYDQTTILNDETPFTQFQTPNRVTYTPIVEENFDWYSILPYLYFSIVVCLLIIATWRILQLVKHAKNGTKRINGLKIVSKTSGFTNCSFFNYVFIDNENLSETELQVLLKHEQVHAQQLHSIDKVLLIVVKAFLWFNPVVYFYDKALEQAHEYEADEATSQSIGTAQYANLLLRLAIAKSEMPLVHNFVKSPIKERIKMLFHSKSKHMKKLLYLLVLPVGLGLVWGFTVKVVDVSTKINHDDKTFTLVLDAGHGGKDNGAKINGYSEKDLTLALSNKIKALAETEGIKVVTTRDQDRNISLNDRLKAEGDILISLHVNSEPIANRGQRNGIEMFIPSANGDPKKTLKANYLSHYVFEGLENIKGINIKDERKAKSLMLLRESKMPSLVLELGYLTNKNDLKFITNEAKQNELAKGIVKGVLIYKESKLKYKDYNYQSKSNNDDASLWGKTLKGKVKSILQTEVGEVLNFKYDDRVIRVYNYAKGKVSVGDEVYITIQATVKDLKVYDAKGNILKELDAPCYGMSMMKTIDGKVLFDGDIKTANKNVVINDEKPITTQSQQFSNLKKPVLISSTHLRVDNKSEITYIKNGKMKIGRKLLEAEEMAYDTRNETLTAKNGKLKLEDGSLISEQYIIYDLKKNSYITNKTPGNKIQMPSVGSEFLTKLKLKNDSLKLTNIFNQPLILSGKIIINEGDYVLNAEVLEADLNSNIIKAHVASVIHKDGSKLSGDIIEYDIVSKKYKVTHPSGSRYGKVALFDLNQVKYTASDSTITNRLTGDISLYGKAKFVDGNQTYQADRMIYNKGKQTLKVRNNVQVFDAKSKTATMADSLDMNFKTGKGIFYGKTLLKYDR